MIVTWYDHSFECEYAVNTGNGIKLYDASYKLINQIWHLSAGDWDHISIDGDWTPEEDIPSESEVLRADLDFVTMENEYLTEVNDHQQADIDYCLMLLEE